MPEVQLKSSAPEAEKHTDGPASAPPGGKPEVRRFYPQLDGLRALAILLVLMNHMDDLKLPGVLAYIRNLGWIGVDAFFVLSGFLITKILLGTRPEPLAFGRFCSSPHLEDVATLLCCFDDLIPGASSRSVRTGDELASASRLSAELHTVVRRAHARADLVAVHRRALLLCMAFRRLSASAAFPALVPSRHLRFPSSNPLLGIAPGIHLQAALH